MLQDPQVLGNDHNKTNSLMSDHTSTVYCHNMPWDSSNNILFKTTHDTYLAEISLQSIDLQIHSK